MKCSECPFLGPFCDDYCVFDFVFEDEVIFNAEVSDSV